MVPTTPVTIAAGATTATFQFATPQTIAPTAGWTVNGVAYAPAEFEIVNVEPLTNSNKYIELQFNQSIGSLVASEVVIRNTENLERVGIETVTLAADGLSAQVTLLGEEEENKLFLAPHVDYTLNITKNGEVQTTVFNLDAVNTARVTNVDKQANRVQGNRLSSDINVDFEHIFGRTATYWVNKDGYITRINLRDENVVYDAINFVTEGGNLYVETLTEDEKYLVNTNTVHVKNSSGGVTQTGITVNSSDFDYESAKLVFNNRGEVVNILAVPSFPSNILVEENEDSVITGYGVELNLEEFTIVKDGRTINAADVKAGDVVYFNNTLKVAEVYNNTITGLIQGSYDSEFRINGKDYDHNGSYVKDGKFESVNEAAIDALKASEEEVKVYLNRAGEVAVITGELGEVVTSEVVSYLTDAALGYELRGKNHLVIPTLSAAGDKEEYDFAVEDLKFIHEVDSNGDVTEYNVGDVSVDRATTTTRITGFDFSVVNATAGTFTLGIEEKTTLDSNGSDAADDFAHAAKNWDESDFVEGSALEVVKNGEGKVVGVIFTESHDLSAANPIKVDEGDRVATLNGLSDDVQIKSSTPVFYKQGNNVINTTYGEIDVNVIEEITDAKVYTDGKDALYIVVTDFTGPTEVDKVETVISAINARDGKIAYLELMTDGVSTEYPVKAGLNIGTLEVGAIVDVEINKTSGNIDSIVADSDNPDSGLVSNVSTQNRTFKLDNADYRVAESGAKVYELVDGKVEVRNFRDLASLGGNNAATISTIGNTNVVDTIVITKNEQIVFTSTQALQPNTVGNLGLVGTTANSSDNTVATATIADGNVEINSVGAGSAVITVRDSSLNTATIDVTVNAYGTITIDSITKHEAPEITSVTLDDTAATIVAGDTHQLTATVVAVGGADTSVTWSSSDPAVATVDTDGLVTVVSGATTGDTATITVTSDFDPTKTATFEVTVQ